MDQLFESLRERLKDYEWVDKLVKFIINKIVFELLIIIVSNSLMRDQDFCQRLRQIKQKYGYADMEKPRPAPSSIPSPSKNNSYKHHYTDRPINFKDNF